MKTAEVAQAASVKILDSALESMESIAMQLTNQLLSLNVGPMQNSSFDTYI